MLLEYALNIDLSISIGSIYLVLNYTKECKEPLEEIFNQLEEIQTCINSYRKIKIILSENSEEELDKGRYIEKIDGDIKFKNVSMKYGKEMILKDVSFTISKCSRVTIVGRTGARKDNNS